jgi:ParB-like chromosome segregation protein Spo0J
LSDILEKRYDKCSLIVRKVDGFYELIDGERGLRALKELGWKTVPVEARELDERKARLCI